jgi:hypothetical protein
VFLFVRPWACAVTTADKRGARATHYKDPAEIPTSGAIWSADFHLSRLKISPTRTTLESFIDTDGEYNASYLKKCGVYDGSFYAIQNPETFFIALPPYAFHNSVNVSAGDFCSKTLNSIFVRTSMSDILNRVANLHTLKKDTAVVMRLEVMKWRI